MPGPAGRHHPACSPSGHEESNGAHHQLHLTGQRVGTASFHSDAVAANRIEPVLQTLGRWAARASIRSIAPPMTCMWFLGGAKPSSPPTC